MKKSSFLQVIFEQYAQFKKLDKKQTLLEQGDISTQAFYVKSGCLRMWYNNFGEDITVKFFASGEIVSSLESFYLEEPSMFGIETIILSEILIVEHSQFKQEAAGLEGFSDEMLSVAVSCMVDYQNLFLNRIMNSAEERYNLFLEKSGHLFDLIPYHYIASYLGITPVSLSRIRKR